MGKKIVRASPLATVPRRTRLHACEGPKRANGDVCTRGGARHSLAVVPQPRERGRSHSRWGSTLARGSPPAAEAIATANQIRSGTIPGRSGTIPARSGTIPGRSGTIPARSGTIPARSGAIPARSGTIPARSATVPGRSGTIPAQSGTISARSATVPGRSGTIPGLKCTQYLPLDRCEGCNFN
jgi:hypothetical protein